MTARQAAGWLVAIVAIAAAVHIALLLGSNPAPTVFDDELAYQKLAQSLGQTGQLALFGKHGLSYSPLYPLLLSPLYAFHLSGPAAYRAVLVLNCLLMALAGFPIYGIARYVLSRPRSIAAVALSSLAPLMLFSSFVMSENLGYPLFLFAAWAMLRTVHRPSVRADTAVVGLCVVCMADRLQFIVLLPAALGAVLLAALVESPGPRRRRSALLHACREHLLLTAANAVLVVGVIAIYVGSRLVALAGQYGYQRSLPLPTPWRIADLFLQHLGAFDLTSGVIPFAGTLLAAALWFRRRGSPQTDAFAAAAAAVSVAVLLITAFAAYGQRFPAGAALPRIHERYYFYVVPLFLIAMIAALGIPRSTALLRLGLAAAAVGALLPLAIPFGTVINPTVGIDAFGLVMFAEEGKHGVVQAVPHAALIAVLLALCLGATYALARPQPAIVLGTLAVFFVGTSVLEWKRQAVAANLAKGASFSARRDWVDAAVGGHQVLLVEAPRPRAGGLGAVETAFFNLSVARLYYLCRPILFTSFGERQIELAPGGQLLDGGVPVHATYALVPVGYGVEGRVVASDARVGLLLIRPAGGILRVASGRRDRWSCPSLTG